MRIPDGWLPIAEAAAKLEISKATMYRWVQRGVVRARRLGIQKILVNVEDLDKLERGEIDYTKRDHTR